jgi:hypothetical protein
MTLAHIPGLSHQGPCYMRRGRFRSMFNPHFLSREAVFNLLLLLFLIRRKLPYSRVVNVIVIKGLYRKIVCIICLFRHCAEGVLRNIVL